jgi:rhodanese-related sulfurtransferase
MRHRVKILALAALALASLGHATLPRAAADEPVTTLAPAALAAEMASAAPKPVILDVRSREEFAAGHVPGTINIPHEEVAARASELSFARDSRVVVYCRSGRRAALALEALKAAGFTKLEHLDGDMLGWEAENRPIAK